MTTINMHKKGFTLIELLVVVAIIGLISGIVLQSIDSMRTKARNTQRLENAEAVAKAFQIASTGGSNQFPSSGGSSVCLGKTPCGPNGGMSSSAPIESMLSANIAGGKIPLDPFWTTGAGDAFWYHSNNTVWSPPGAYLIWRMEDQLSMSCGRGKSAMISGVTYCTLHLGPGTN